MRACFTLSNVPAQAEALMAGRILPELESGAVGEHDPSTAALIGRLRV